MMDPNESLISENVAALSVSEIKAMAIRGAGVKGAASLTWGLPSFRTPEYIRQGVVELLDADPDIGKYSLPDGLPELRGLAARVHREATGVEVDPTANVMITAGNMEALNGLFHALFAPGDEVIVTDPGFASHIQQIKLCGGVPVFWRLNESENWSLDLGALPKLISERTKAILLVSPSNPTGKIFSEKELRQIGDIAQESNVCILLDDPYSHFTYENAKSYFNLSSVAEFQNRIAYLFTFSKTYAMSGWRIGYMVLPEFLKREVVKVHDSTMICAPRISQIAAYVALSHEPVHLAEFEKTLSNRREQICARLDAVPHVFDYAKPEGAYYIFPRIVADHTTSFEFAISLLEKAKVIVTPGSAFGPNGEHHVRMAYCVDEQTIDLAFDRIEAHFNKI